MQSVRAHTPQRAVVPIALFIGVLDSDVLGVGCGAFVGALWPVTDQAGLAFARAFYERVA
jgi:hypothetical protein